MNMNFDKKTLGEGGLEILAGTTVGVISLHAARKFPKFAGWILLGTGLVGYLVDNRIVKTASIVAVSLGVIKSANMLGQVDGVPVDTGIKGIVNKIIPQLNGVEGLGDATTVEQINENILGTAGIGGYDLGDLGETEGDKLLAQLTGSDNTEAPEIVESFGNLL